MVNETNVYELLNDGLYPGRWKRLHGMRGIPDYLVGWPIKKLIALRQFFVEVKEIAKRPKTRTTKFELELRPAQIPFFKDWPGEKYVLVRWLDTKTYSWFSGKDRFTSLSREIPGPFK